MKVEVAIKAIRDVTSMRPSNAIILGSGLGGLVCEIEQAVAIDFAAIPGFAHSTADGHAGQLVFGTLAGQPVVAMAGRLHRYGGWCVDQVTFPVRVMAALGANRLIVSNAAGGLNPNLRVGDIVLIEDHIDWMFGEPALRFSAGPGSSKSQTRQLDSVSLSERQENSAVAGVPLLARSPELYDRAMIAEALAAARREDFTVYRGTYLATLGPNYETRAEYRMMRRIGADVVGMSTVPEVLAAAQLEMRVLALSLVSNLARPDIGTQAAHDEVLLAGANAEADVLAIVRAVVAG